MTTTQTETYYRLAWAGPIGKTWDETNSSGFLEEGDGDGPGGTHTFDTIADLARQWADAGTDVIVNEDDGEVLVTVEGERLRVVGQDPVLVHRSAEAAAQQIADTFHTLDDGDLDRLHSDEGLIIDDIAVWHDENNNKIVAFTNPNHPDEGEEWAEVQLVSYVCHYCDASATGTYDALNIGQEGSVLPYDDIEVCDDCANERGLV
jgi:hypothetical protein